MVMDSIPDHLNTLEGVLGVCFTLYRQRFRFVFMGHYKVVTEYQLIFMSLNIQNVNGNYSFQTLYSNNNRRNLPYGDH